MADKNKVNIALAANGPYFPGLYVTACSIAMYANPETRLAYWILDGGISAEDWRLLESSLMRLHPKCDIKHIAIDENDVRFARFQRWHGNAMAYARLLLPELMPDEDYVVYCDVDFLWMRDITELWAERRPEVSLIGVRDPGYWSILKEKEWYATHGYEFDRDHYFCSGLSFLNLGYFRSHGLSEQCFKFLERYDDLNFPDQTALNVVTYGSAKIVDDKWMRFSGSMTREMYGEGSVIHYVNATPWNGRATKRIFYVCEVLPDVSRVWFAIYARARQIPNLKAALSFMPLRKYVLTRILFLLLSSLPFQICYNVAIKLGVCAVGIAAYRKNLVRLRVPCDSQKNSFVE